MHDEFVAEISTLRQAESTPLGFVVSHSVEPTPLARILAGSSPADSNAVFTAFARFSDKG